MNRVIALISLLHEPASPGSATRSFRGVPVLNWTLQRLSQSQRIDDALVLCWDDQQPAVQEAAGDLHVQIQSKGERYALPTLSALAAARRWADGWRGGLLGSCDFDLGYHAGWAKETAERLDADALVLIDPAAALVDPALIDDVIEHAESQPDAELCFSPAAPGLAGTLLRRSLIDRLAIAQIHPGRLLTYWPDHHGVDPLGKSGCVPTAMPLARTTAGFKLNSARQLARLDRATADLNGHLIHATAEELVTRVRDAQPQDSLPRDIVLELNTPRAARPVYHPGTTLNISRAPFSPSLAQSLFTELAAADDLRLTLAGVGDPLLASDCFEIIRQARAVGVGAIHLETDLLTEDPAVLEQLAAAPLDAITIHFPAATAATYEKLMGINGFGRVMHNIAALEKVIQQQGRGLPLLVPTFTKTRANLAEMDAWYDYWIRRLGHAVILGPSDFAGQIPDLAVADMAPPQRRPCARLASRLTILCDGTVVSCEQDILAKQPLGVLGETPLTEIWQSRFTSLRQCHQSSTWATLPLCGNCRDWHRP